MRGCTIVDTVGSSVVEMFVDTVVGAVVDCVCTDSDSDSDSYINIGVFLRRDSDGKLGSRQIATIEV